MRKIVLSLIFVISFIRVCGQEKNVNPVQFFTPNASSIGKYGQIPINYFNGLPQIQIPLAIFKAKGYELPISLSYTSSGNSVDSHPGWVGLGWTLSAGGCINRIVNGLKDEMTKEEFFNRSGTSSPSPNNVGYYYNTGTMNNSNWNDTIFLDGILKSPVTYEMSPDEFQVNIDDISASFYFVENGEIKIKSKSNANFKVKIDLATNNSFNLFTSDDDIDKIGLSINNFTYINQITLIKDNGMKYYFGGDPSSIEFSFEDFKGTANTWHIKKIEMPDGEVLTFNYEKDGIPIVVHDSHFFQSFTIKDSHQGEIVNSKLLTSEYLNYFFKVINPSYLTSISSLLSDKVMYFKRSKSVELPYKIDSLAFRKRFLVQNHLVDESGVIDRISRSFFTQKSYYMKLDTIIYNDNKYTFNYSNSINKRLKLLSLSYLDQKNNPAYKYLFDYNKIDLPDYNSKMTDNWGFYNNKCYKDVFFENLSSFRTPDTTYMKAEVLEKIIYPTGGYSQFKYEAHHFSKIAQQFPFQLKDSDDNIAGGLRIKEIQTVDTNNKSDVREFEYLNKDGKSSGILSGMPIYSVIGKKYEHYRYNGWDGLGYTNMDIGYTYVYSLMNEQILNQLGNTNGNHVTYSRVAEKRSDGSRIIYNYANHDKFPDEAPVVTDNIDNKLPVNSFITKELERGLLDSVEYYKNNTIVKKNIYFYNSNPNRYNEFVKSIEGYSLYTMRRLSAVKKYTFYPYLTLEKSIDYTNNGTNPIVNITEYSYNQNKLKSKIITYGSNNERFTSEFKFSGDDFALGTVYSSMKLSNILDKPIEVIKIKDGMILSGLLTTYKKNENTYVPENSYVSYLKSPLSYSTYNKFDGISKDAHYETPETEYLSYDKYGNITQLKNDKQIFITYLWGYNYQHPVAEIANATLDEVRNSIGESTIEQISSAVSLTNEMVNTLYNLRYKLPKSQVSIYTYKPITGIISSTDSKGLTLYYDYDNFGRLEQTYTIEKQKKKIVKLYRYNYLKK